MRNEIQAVDLTKIKMAVKSGIPLAITTYTLPHSMEIYMNNVLSAFFKELKQEHMIQYLTYCQSELIINAKKANTKRIYFKEKGLDINIESDYEKGMKTFKTDTLSNIDFFLAKQRQAGLYVKLIFQVRNNVIRMEVNNNCELTYFEFKRIHDKLCRAQQYTSIEDTIDQVLDESEGAGLGLVIMILMLRKLGMSEDNFQTICEGGITKTRILLPLGGAFQSEVSIVSKELEDAIEGLPQFPENIIRLQELLNNPHSQISDIARIIGTDVSITAEVLKLANSPALGLGQKCGNIMEAVKMIGLRGIQNMLFSIGTVGILSKLPGKAEKLWAHAYKVAFYSYNIAKNFYPNKNTLIEDSYVCGLLHDMGKILFEGTHPTYLEKVKNICVEKGIDSDLFEKILSGVNHGELGAKVAEKWNFPQNIIDVIRYHHAPSAVPASSKILSNIVFLADIITHYQDGEVDYYQIDKSVLDFFKFTSSKQFDEVIVKLNASYEGLKS